ncbi:MAG: Holliday junction resolvase RecU [Clostridiales bacterium]|jgi:recombination protein U|nr:Holliday junction resolvase RecU [Clostridiales bacterium]
MGYWNTRGLRGSTLEEMVNLTNEAYREKQLALIQKIPTPITPVELNAKKRTISLAYFEQKSTVDYIGCVQGIPVCFDAKETSRKSLPLQNIHHHQIRFMQDFHNQKGLAFFLVYFKTAGEYFYLPFETFKDYWNKSQKGERKSVPYEAFDKKLQIRSKGKFFLHYLEAMDTYLQNLKKD